jgi:hypothetical protein
VENRGSRRSQSVLSYYELLAEIDAALDPEPASTSRLIHAVCSLRDDSFEAVTLHEREHLFCRLVGYLRNADVIMWLDCRTEDLASLRERLSRQVFSTPHQHIEGVEDDVRFRRAKILQQIEVRLALLVERDQLTIAYRLIGQARQISSYISETS